MSSIDTIITLKQLNNICQIYNQLDIGSLRILVKEAGIKFIDGISIDTATKDSLCKALSDELNMVKNLRDRADTYVTLEFVYPQKNPTIEHVSTATINSNFIDRALAFKMNRTNSEVCEPVVQLPADIILPETFLTIYNIFERYNDTGKITTGDLNLLAKNKDILKYLGVEIPQPKSLTVALSFGGNEFGQLGIKDTTSKSVPTPVAFPSLSELPGISPIRVSRSWTHTTLLAEEGSVYVFGSNGFGQLGLGDTQNRRQPERISNIPKCIALSCGGVHTTLLTEEGSVYVFGFNKYGQLGLGDTEDRPQPERISNIPKCIALNCGGNNTTLLTEEGSVYVFGSNKYGQLGLGDTRDRFQPELIPNIPKCISLSCGGGHTALLTEEGSVYVFGYNGYGQLGLGDTQSRLQPERIPNIPKCIALSCGVVHTALLTEEGSVYVFGSNESGRLGLGDTQERLQPERIPNIPKCIALSCGGYHTALLTEEGSVYVFGYNGYGQLGLGDTQSRLQPERIPNIPKCIALSCGERHTILIVVN